MGAVQSVQGLEENQPGISDAKEIPCPSPLRVSVTKSTSFCTSSLIVFPESWFIHFYHHGDANNSFFKKSLSLILSTTQTDLQTSDILLVLSVYRGLLKSAAQILRSEPKNGEEDRGGDEGRGPEEGEKESGRSRGQGRRERERSATALYYMVYLFKNSYSLFFSWIKVLSLISFTAGQWSFILSLVLYLIRR